MLDNVRFDADACLLLLPRAVFADGFGMANGQVVEEHFSFLDREGHIVWNAKRSALPK